MHGVRRTVGAGLVANCVQTYGILKTELALTYCRAFLSLAF